MLNHMFPDPFIIQNGLMARRSLLQSHAIIAYASATDLPSSALLRMAITTRRLQFRNCRESGQFGGKVGAFLFNLPCLRILVAEGVKNWYSLGLDAIALDCVPSIREIDVSYGSNSRQDADMITDPMPPPYNFLRRIFEAQRLRGGSYRAR